MHLLKSWCQLRDTRRKVATMRAEIKVNIGMGREYIVNLNGGAVSSVCYNASVSNECSSLALGSVTIWPVLGMLFQREMCYAS
jgi:hypothetical protein